MYNELQPLVCSYRAFHGFGQVEFPDGGSILGFFNTAPAASKNNAPFKSGQNCLKNNHIALLI